MVTECDYPGERYCSTSDGPSTYLCPNYQLRRANIWGNVILVNGCLSLGKADARAFKQAVRGICDAAASNIGVTNTLVTWRNQQVAQSNSCTTNSMAAARPHLLPS